MYISLGVVSTWRRRECIGEMVRVMNNGGRGSCYDFIRQSEHRMTCSQASDIEFKLYVMFVLSRQCF